MSRETLLGVLVALTLCVACGQNRKMIQIHQVDDGREITLAQGETFELSLPENPTTGFRWVFAGKPGQCCEMVTDRFEAGGGSPGSGGTHRWQFRAKQAGSASIELEYRRPWEKDTLAGQKFKVEIRVR